MGVKVETTKPGDGMYPGSCCLRCFMYNLYQFLFYLFISQQTINEHTYIDKMIVGRPSTYLCLLLFCVSLDSSVYQAVSTDFCTAVVLLQMSALQGSLELVSSSVLKVINTFIYLIALLSDLTFLSPCLGVIKFPATRIGI